MLRMSSRPYYSSFCYSSSICATWVFYTLRSLWRPFEVRYYLLIIINHILQQISEMNFSFYCKGLVILNYFFPSSRCDRYPLFSFCQLRRSHDVCQCLLLIKRGRPTSRRLYPFISSCPYFSNTAPAILLLLFAQAVTLPFFIFVKQNHFLFILKKC